uniref:Glucagon / GIP / secretin / VIP family domain-containing protein n=1 Tax=Eptatretus burgeri TaxID=7764 RepID=A0A8C4QMN7_EPTBU
MCERMQFTLSKDDCQCYSLPCRPLADDRGGRSDYGVHAAQTFHKDSVVADGGRTSTESFRDAEALYGLMHNALDRFGRLKLPARALVSPEEQKNDEPTKRHSDGLFTDLYSRYRKKMAVRKYLSTVLGKRKYFKHRQKQKQIPYMATYNRPVHVM